MGPADLVADLKRVHVGGGDVIVHPAQREVARNGDDGNQRVGRIAGSIDADRIGRKIRLRLQKSDAADIADQTFIQEMGSDRRGQLQERNLVVERRHHPVAGSIQAAAEGLRLGIVRVEVSLRQGVLRRKNIVRVHHELIFGVV